MSTHPSRLATLRQRERERLLYVYERKPFDLLITYNHYTIALLTSLALVGGILATLARERLGQSIRISFPALERLRTCSTFGS
jgi:hypothetical protein